MSTSRKEMGMQTHDNEVNTLTDDMLVEILTRMPLKSFSRSKCVSKSWQSLLSSNYVRNKLPFIVSGVFQPSSSTTKKGPTYMSTSDDNLESTYIDSLSSKLNSTLIDCSNGLLLFYSSLTNTFNVCNPTTKKCVSLPKPMKETKLSVLAFDPCHSHHFKVVNFVGWRGRKADLEVYSSESGNWAQHKVDWGIDTNALSATIRYMDGILYILAQPKQVATMDLGDMSCRLIELPEPTTVECCVAKVGGRLHYWVHDGDKLKIWVLEDDGDEEEGEWRLKHCACIKMGKFRVLALDPERDVVYLRVKGKLVAYDICEEMVERTFEFGDEGEGYLVQAWVFPFSEHLEDCLAM